MNQGTASNGMVPPAGGVMLDEGIPLFVQIAEQLADEIADGALAEGDRVPSSNEFAVYHRINPATAAKGINVLVDQGLLEKRRGVGMFVVHGAREKLLDQRREEFAAHFVTPMVAEARRLGLDDDTLLGLIRRASQDHPDPGRPTLHHGASR